MTDDDIPKPKGMTAALWTFHGDADGVTLVIELGRDRAVTLSCSEEAV